MAQTLPNKLLNSALDWVSENRCFFFFLPEHQRMTAAEPHLSSDMQALTDDWETSWMWTFKAFLHVSMEQIMVLLCPTSNTLLYFLNSCSNDSCPEPDIFTHTHSRNSTTHRYVNSSWFNPLILSITPDVFMVRTGSTVDQQNVRQQVVYKRLQDFKDKPQCHLLFVTLPH